MANTAYRKPIIGGDLDAWGPFNDAFIRDTIGKCSVKLYSNAGALTVSKGRIGINDGVVEALSVIDTLTAVSLAAIGNSQWAEVYMTVAGTAVTFGVAAIAGATLPDVIHATFTGAWSQEYGGYYINPSRRCIGLAWKGSTGVLDGIINVNGDGVEGYNGYSYLTSAQTQKMQWDKYKDKFRKWCDVTWSGWDMDSTGNFGINISITNWNTCVEIQPIFLNTATTEKWDLHVDGGGYTYLSNALLRMVRAGGGIYDAAAFNNCSGITRLEFTQ
jgi:hypothetical protein